MSDQSHHFSLSKFRLKVGSVALTAIPICFESVVQYIAVNIKFLSKLFKTAGGNIFLLLTHTHTHLIYRHVAYWTRAPAGRSD